jgi:SHS2 domain-containing protein
MPFEILEHPADVGLRASGSSLEEALAAAVEALSSILVGDIEPSESELRRANFAGDDLAHAVVMLLEECLFLLDAEGMVVRGASVRQVPSLPVSETTFEVEYRCEAFDENRHCEGTAVKAITYHQLSVAQTGRGWEVVVFVDI